MRRGGFGDELPSTRGLLGHLRTATAAGSASCLRLLHQLFWGNDWSWLRWKSYSLTLPNAPSQKALTQVVPQVLISLFTLLPLMENCCKARSAPSCSSLTPTARKTCPHRGCCPPLPPSPPSPGPSGTARPTALASRGSRRCGTRLVAYSGNLPGLTAPQRPPLLHPLPVLGSRAAPAEPLGTRHLPLRRRRGRPGPGRPPARRTVPEAASRALRWIWTFSALPLPTSPFLTEEEK